MSNLDAIKRKIKNLLNRTVEHGATKEEAETSLQLANRLMTRYMIEKHQLGDNDNNVCSQIEVELTRRNPCITSMLSYLAEAFECEFFYQRRRKKGWFFGYSADLDMCRYLHGLIINSMENELNFYKASDIYSAYRWAGHNARVLNNDFIEGFCSALKSKLIVLREKKKKEVKLSTGTDLILVKEDLVSQELKKVHPDIVTKSIKPREVKTNCYYDGKKKGEELQLNMGISGDSEQLRLLEEAVA